MLIVLLLILRKFLVVAGNTDKTIRCPSYNCKGWKPDMVVAGNTDKTIRWPSYNYKGWKPDAVYVYSGVCGTYGYL